MRRLTVSALSRVESALDLAEGQFETVTGAAMAGAIKAERFGLRFLHAETGAAIDHPAGMRPGEEVTKVLVIGIVRSGRFVTAPEDIAAGLSRFHEEPEPPPPPEITVERSSPMPAHSRMRGR